MWMALALETLRQLIKEHSYEILLLVVNALFLFAAYTLVNNYAERNGAEVDRLARLLTSCLVEQYSKNDDIFGTPGPAGVGRVPFGPR